MREVTKAEEIELEEVIAARSLEMAEENLAKEYVFVSEEEESELAKEGGGGRQRANRHRLRLRRTSR